MVISKLRNEKKELSLGRELERQGRYPRLLTNTKNTEPVPQEEWPAQAKQVTVDFNLPIKTPCVITLRFQPLG